MATRPQPQLALRPLGDLAVAQLRSLLAEERRAWAERLSWSLADASDLVEQAIRCGVLPGSAVLDGAVPVAYVTHQTNPGCFRACSAHVVTGAPRGAASLLAEAVLAAPASRDRRFEGQLTVFEAQLELDLAFAASGVNVEPRAFLAADLETALGRLPSSAVPLMPVGGGTLEGCARVLVEAHAGGVEALINTAFRDRASALAYMGDLTAAAGCGTLHPGASRVARAGGRIVGFCLVTVVAPGVGHVPQVAVHPAAQGGGLGAALLRHAFQALRGDGCRRVTLSVSCRNERAAGWYARLGFAEAARFSAYWRDP